MWIHLVVSIHCICRCKESKICRLRIDESNKKVLVIYQTVLYGDRKKISWKKVETKVIVLNPKVIRETDSTTKVKSKDLVVNKRVIKILLRGDTNIEAILFDLRMTKGFVWISEGINLKGTYQRENKNLHDSWPINL